MRKPIACAVLAVSLVSASPCAGQDLSSRADALVSAAEARGFSGVVRIEKDGAVVLEKGYGLANRAAKIPFTASTVVQIGSNTKDFTAVAILQLKENGLLDLVDPLAKFLPDAPQDKRAITVSQLLDHEAGFPLGLGPDFDPVSRDQLVDAAMRFKLLFEPGKRRSYSNTGYALLAAIIEKVSGKSYDEYVRDNILIPLGLRDTGFHLPQFDERRLAHGYRAGGEDHGTMLSKPSAPDGPYWNLRGNGGMLSTVGDMHSFYDALFETDKLLKPETRGLRFNPGEPIALAGSDLVSVFVYERDPAAKLEVIVASTNAEQKAGLVLEELRKAIDPRDAQQQMQIVGADAPLARRDGKAPPTAIAAIAAELVATINTGDIAVLGRFIAARFAAGPDAPTVDERLQRLRGLHGNLGKLEVLGMTMADGGPLEVRLKTEKEGPAVLILDIELNAPHNIRRLGLQVAGG